MATPFVLKGTVREGQDLFPEARVPLASTGNAIIQSDVSGTITLTIYDISGATPNTAIYTDATLTAANLIFDALQSWSLDGIGYNFRDQVAISDIVAAAAVLEGGKSYKLVYQIPTTSEGNIFVVGVAAIEPHRAT
jgi:hypothetical protein